MTNKELNERVATLQNSLSVLLNSHTDLQKTVLNLQAQLVKHLKYHMEHFDGTAEKRD